MLRQRLLYLLVRPLNELLLVFKEFAMNAFDRLDRLVVEPNGELLSITIAKALTVPTTARISLNVWLSALSPATAADSPRGSYTSACISTGLTR